MSYVHVPPRECQIKADLHGTILSHGTSLRHSLGHNCHKVLRHVFETPQLFSCHIRVVKEVACDKIAACKLAFMVQGQTFVIYGFMVPWIQTRTEMTALQEGCSLT